MQGQRVREIKNEFIQAEMQIIEKAGALNTLDKKPDIDSEILQEHLINWATCLNSQSRMGMKSP